MAWANLQIFRDTDTNVLYVHHTLNLRRRIRVLAEQTFRLDGLRGSTWLVSSRGQVADPALRPHVNWLIENVIWPNQDALRKLQEMRYWVCVSFHDYAPPEWADRAIVDARLEAIGITFDFELEQHE